MTTIRTAHIISHTHWDREWYLPYEKHHVLLVKLMDTLLDTLERDEEYRSFYLDGQTIILEDYLQVRPEKREKLAHYIRAGRIFIGPWYILQDAFLTSSEANVRNMQLGHKDAVAYGTIAKVGYFPDTFGNIGQAPQLMRQSGIDNAVFGRGVKPTGFNNTVSDAGYESSFSELLWEGPDGSRVLGILFANWYSNGNEIPADEAEAASYWERKLADAEKFASTDQLLFMNGCDHQPIQQDLSAAMSVARKLYPDTEFVHSSFAEFLQAVGSSLDRELSVVRGELRSQRTDGWSTLVNTASARVYLKQMNQLGQTMLEKVAEPLASWASLLGADYPHHLFTYAWKTLMQNHPHDSICGCSVDEVHREMVTRFDKSRHVAETIVEDSKRWLANAVDTSAFAGFGENALPLVVFNTTGWSRSGVISMELDIQRIYFREGHSLDVMNRMMREVDISGRVLVADDGSIVACEAEDLGLQFSYDLPDDQFRQPYMCRRVKLTFEAADVPALGLKAFAYVRQSEKIGQAAVHGAGALQAGRSFMENEYVRVDIAQDGSLSVTEKQSGLVYRDLCVYEDTGDIGNEYMYKQPNGEQSRTTKGLPAVVELTEMTPYRAAFRIVHEWEIPASADELFEREKQEAVYFPQRQAQRIDEMVPMYIETTVSLTRLGKGIHVKTSFVNEAKDHRVRMLFPTDLSATSHRADAIFEIAQRDNEPAVEWQNPSNCQHQQAFADVTDESGRGGLTIANLGLNEYEVLRDGRNTIAVTLLRSVAELGDWGVFPTPEAQCLGAHQAELMIIPHAGDGVESGAFAEAYQFQTPWTTEQTSVHQGAISAVAAPLAWEGSQQAFSSMKLDETSGDLMLRWFNMTPQASELTVSSPLLAGGAYKTTILEQKAAELELEAGGGDQLVVEVGPCEIVTYGIPKQ